MSHKNINQLLSSQIKKIRIEKGIKQQTLAFALNKNQSTYCRMEAGLVSISYAELIQICEVLNEPIYQILLEVNPEIFKYKPIEMKPNGFPST